MEDFTERKLEQLSSIGEEYKQKRKEKKISLHEASRATSIQRKYLEAIEENNYDVLPAHVYVVNFLKRYARFLDIDEETAARNFAQEAKTRAPLVKKHAGDAGLIRPRLVVNPAIIKRSIAGGIGILVFVYLFFQFAGMILPPSIYLASPALLSPETHESAIALRGQVKRGSVLTVNGESVYIDETGEFEENVLLSGGTNIFELVATNRFNKKTVLQIKITRIVSFHD